MDVDGLDGDPPRFRENKGRNQDSAVIRDLYVSLEEVFTGVTKKRKITRNVLLTADGRSTLREEKILTIEVKPGWKEGTKIIFEKEGDQSPGKIPADIIFIIRDKPHPLFKRDGANLVYTAKIPLRDALRGTLVSVPTLTGQRSPSTLTRKRRNLKQPDVSKDTVFPIQRIRRGRVILSSTLISNSL
ncbi:putative dnaJ protein-like 1-like [Penaeus vannamei]|uniref:Putative dnaJ protein-like 1-like n=1 Tax=Penaeus vannamei TaxID=6689 RepID=A0A423T3I6_PENVA|nr:putative dnaJ protein-like 1-like [Penaeus vannamei]